MRVKINRSLCPAQLPTCERCLGRFLLYPEGYERRCFEEIEDDHSDLLTIELSTGDHTVVMVLDEAARTEMGAAGWTDYMDFNVPMYRNIVGA
jgi:hypothetical protein